MGYRRTTAPTPIAGAELTGAMVGIGMLFAARPTPHADIEDTLISASSAGMSGDLRVLSVLATWIGVHSAFINVDRLFRSLTDVESKSTRTFWAAVAHWLDKDPRFARLRDLHGGSRLDLIDGGSQFLIDRDGQDPRFAGGPLIVPGKTLRHRTADVLSPAEIAKQHRTYCWRLIMGPSYRADLWAHLEANPQLTVSDLARRARSSIGAAWQVKHDRQLLAAS